MVAPIESLTYDAFDRANTALWRATMFQFDQDRENIEDDTKAFIDTSFKKLRSAEGELFVEDEEEKLRSFCWVGMHLESVCSRPHNTIYGTNGESTGTTFSSYEG